MKAATTNIMISKSVEPQTTDEIELMLSCVADATNARVTATGLAFYRAVAAAYNVAFVKNQTSLRASAMPLKHRAVSEETLRRRSRCLFDRVRPGPSNVVFRFDTVSSARRPALICSTRWRR